MFESFNERERRLLTLMIVIFSVFGGIILFQTVLKGGGDVEAEIESYRQALDALAQAGDVANQSSGPTLEDLEANEIQLHSFVEGQCLNTSVERPSSYTDNSTVILDGAIIVEETVATINTVDPIPLSALLSSIRQAQDENLVVLKAITIQPARGRSGRYRVDLTIQTFRVGDGDS